MLKILQKIKNMASTDSAASNSLTLSDVSAWFEQQYGGYGPDIGEITYFICLKTLAESLGKMPLHLVDADKNQIIDNELLPIIMMGPNSKQTPAKFFTQMEFNRNHYGNAYAFIAKDVNGYLTGLYPLDPLKVQIYVNNVCDPELEDFYYLYTAVDGKQRWYSKAEMLHVTSWICEEHGLAGKSVREILATYMAGNKSAQAFLNDLYRNGLTANVVVKYLGDLNSASKQKLKDQLKELSSTKKDRILTLPIGWDAAPLNLSMADAQFLELNKFSAEKISAAFGIKPNSQNDYSKASYANSSSQNLSFYTDCLLYILSIYEQELTRKLLPVPRILKGEKFEFNFSVILRADPLQQAQMLKEYVTGSIMKINEGRRKAGLPPSPEGDVILVNGTYVDLSKLGEAYKGGGN